MANKKKMVKKKTVLVQNEQIDTFDLITGTIEMMFAGTVGIAVLLVLLLAIKTFFKLLVFGQA